MASFRKSIKGDSNQQTEEFSHNRITIEAGGAGVLLVAFLIALITAAIIWLVIHFGGLLLVSLLALWLVAATGGIWLLGVWIYTRTGILLSERARARNLERFLSAPAETHSIYLQDLQPHYDVFEISANVIAAGVPMVLPPPEDKKISADDETIVQMWADGGANLEQIVDALKPSGVSYYRVQKVIADAKKRGVVRKN